MSPPPTSPSNPGLSRFALFTALATLGLLGAGGLVTSHGAGLAVPDWPNTYGYNLFFFPVSRWVGGVFYEHTHRLLASAVGLLTSLLALWLYGSSARPFLRRLGPGLLGLALVAVLAWPAHWSDALVLGLTGAALWAASSAWPWGAPSPRWLRRLGLVAFGAVILQGVLGGLRVVLLKDQLGILHATLAQVCFVLVCAIALFTNRWWTEGRRAQPAAAVADEMRRRSRRRKEADPKVVDETGCRKSESPPFFLLGTTLLILGQLVVGATMRHQHAGLAIPDFPLAYGRLWPPMDAASVALYNQQRLEVLSLNPITSWGIGLQMVHRLTALLILGAVAFCARSTRRRLGRHSLPARLALLWLALLLTQALLGAATIWSNKAADLATAHVLVGALSLALGAILCLVWFREVPPPS